MDKKTWILALLGSFYGCAASTKSWERQAASVAPVAWVQLEAGTSFLVRSVQRAGDCPSLLADAKAIPMQPRSKPAANFPQTVCEARLPSLVAKLTLDGHTLPTPKADPRRIVVLGDTGCRIVQKNHYSVVQDCNDPAAWPFAEVARSAAAWRPDLVIHVGDYHYRESPCPRGNKGCMGATAGDNEPSWFEDFFNPSKALREAAPWIYVRGNHELCARGGKGWFRYLDPAPFRECVDHTPPFWVTVGDHQVAVIDAADDANIQPSLDQLGSPVPGPLRWLTLHRPFLTPGADDELTTTAATLPRGLRKAISAVFTGHEHHLSLNQFPDARPPELISGNGGTNLEDPPPEINPAFVRAEASDFGFLTLERKTPTEWAMVEHDRRGEETLHCVLKETPGRKATFRCEDEYRAASQKKNPVL